MSHVFHICCSAAAPVNVMHLKVRRGVILASWAREDTCMNACYVVSTQRRYELNREWMKLMCNSRLSLIFDVNISISEPAFWQSTSSHQQAMWSLKAKFKKNEVRINNWRCFQPSTWSTVEAMETQMCCHYYDNNTEGSIDNFQHGIELFTQL